MKARIFLLFALLIFLSGCVDLGMKTDITQKIYRNGESDFSMTISAKTSEDLNLIKGSFEINPEFSGKSRYTDADGQAIYNFYGVKVGDKLFNINEDSDNQLIDNEKYSLKKEFKFPYYTYTYLMDFSGSDSAKDVRKEIEEKCAQSAELKKQLDEASKASSEKLEKLKLAESQEEKQAVLGEVRAARDVEVKIRDQIAEITSGIQCGEKKVEGEFTGVTYVIEGFGKVKDTNGEEIDKKTVKFSVPLDSEKAYYVTFKDLFISNWFGKIF